MMLASFICMSCGKKIVDKNRTQDLDGQNTARLNPVNETIKVSLNRDHELLKGSHFLKKRIFYKMPEFIEASNGLEKLNIFFHVIEDRFEYVCTFLKKDQELVFDECIDDEGYLITHLIPGETHYLPAGEEVYLEATTKNSNSSIVKLQVLNK